MITTSVLYFVGLLLLIVWEVLCFIKKVSIKRNFLYSLFIIYMVLMIGVTLFPIPWQHIKSFISSPVNYIPFKSIYETLTSHDSAREIARQLAGNIIMFFPLGILLQFINRHKKSINNLMIAIGISFSIEILQGIIGLTIAGFLYRTVDIDDVILNTIGYMLGFAIYLIIPKKAKTSFL